jgi:glycosyltransferase involved in cell wall biosynthesis
MYTKNLVSVITPNYNCRNFITQTIESVIAQTYEEWEMIIVDDFSDDGSYEIALNYSKKDSRIKVFRNDKNSGAAISRNKALELAQGEFIAFLDSDDLWMPEKLEIQISFMRENNCDFSFCEYEHIDEENKTLFKVAKVIKKLTYWKMMFHCFPGCLTVMYNQNVVGKVYANDIKKNNDNALFYPVLKRCKNAMGIPSCLALYRIRRGSISRNKFKMIKPYIIVLHEFEGHNIILSYFCVLTHFIIKILFKYKSIKSTESLCNIYKFK